MPMTRTAGLVTIELTPNDFKFLMMVLGFAAASATEWESDQEIITRVNIMGLANVINEGNPQWVPYAVQPKGAQP